MRSMMEGRRRRIRSRKHAPLRFGPLHHPSGGPPPLRKQGRNDNGFNPRWRSAAGGFTLVELMVVLAILGLMSAAVVLAIPDPRGGLVSEAQTFAARVQAAQERAIMDNRAVALRLTPAGYSFERAANGGWQPIAERPFGEARWVEGTGVAAASDRVVFDSTGFADPLEITLRRGADQVAVTISEGGDVLVRP